MEEGAEINMLPPSEPQKSRCVTLKLVGSLGNFLEDLKALPPEASIFNIVKRGSRLDVLLTVPYSTEEMAEGWAEYEKEMVAYKAWLRENKERLEAEAEEKIARAKEAYANAELFWDRQEQELVERAEAAYERLQRLKESNEDFRRATEAYARLVGLTYIELGLTHIELGS